MLASYHALRSHLRRAHRAVRLTPLLTLAIAVTTTSLARGAIRLRSATLTPNDGLDPARVCAEKAPPALYAVAAQGRIDAPFRESLAQEGAEILAYLPDDALAVWAPPSTAAAIAARTEVAFVAAIPPALRLAPELQSAPRGSLVPVEVLTVPGLDPGQVARRIEALGFTVDGYGSGPRFGRVAARWSAGDLDRLLAAAAVDGVFSVGLRPRYRLLNDTSIWVGQSGLDGAGATPLFAAGIHGEGQVVAVLDTGVDLDMCYFVDPAGSPPLNTGAGTATDPGLRKVIAYDFLYAGDDPADPHQYDDHGHGTHVSGSVLGDNIANPIVHDPGDGMAPAAQLVVQDGGFAVDDCSDLPALGCPVIDLTPVFEQAWAQGARIHNNSWGDRENFTPQNTYTAACVDVDDFMWTHPDFLLVFAAGNEGSAGDDTVGSPSVAKDTLSVGATLRGSAADSIAGFSSRGWAADGRTKPTVTCPGSGIVSARNDRDIRTGNCSTTGMSGTSMASPTCAGLAALARQYFTDGFYPSGWPRAAHAFTPSAALVKAVLINSARPMAAEPPPISRVQGYGRVTLADTLALAGGDLDLFVADEAAAFPTGATASRRYDLELASSARALKVTLVWTDPPSNPLAAINLVNDLDLVVSGPTGTFLGNVLSGGVSTTGGSADRLNVEEQVLIPSPIQGTYSVEVVPHAIPEGPQGFALVATGDFPEPPGVVFHGLVSVDDSVDPDCSDGDGFADDGETIRVAVQVANPGTSDATGVEVSLDTTSPWLTILTPSPVSVGAVAPGLATAEFDLAVDGAPCAGEAELAVTVTSAENPWPEYGRAFLVLEQDRTFGDKHLDFERGLVDWDGQTWTASGGFIPTGGRVASGRQSLWAGIPPGPGHCDGSGTTDGAWMCAILVSPTVVPTASSQLRLATWYETEPYTTGQWWDRANVHLIDGLSHVLLQPVAGRPYDGGDGQRASLCHVGRQDGWAGPDGTSWQTTTFDLSPWAGQPVRIEVNYNTDGREACEGLYVDDIAITGLEMTPCDRTTCGPCDVGSLSRLQALRGIKGPPGGATFTWDEAGSGALQVHLNTVDDKRHLTDLDPQSPRQAGRGQGVLQCWTDRGECSDPDALDPVPPLLYYQALPACGPDDVDEGPV